MTQTTITHCSRFPNEVRLYLLANSPLARLLPLISNPKKRAKALCNWAATCDLVGLPEAAREITLTLAHMPGWVHNMAHDLVVWNRRDAADKELARELTELFLATGIHLDDLAAILTRRTHSSDTRFPYADFRNEVRFRGTIPWDSAFLEINLPPQAQVTALRKLEAEGKLSGRITAERLNLMYEAERNQGTA